MPYDAQYFINKFSAIPDEQWRIGGYGRDGGPHCALGHCGARLFQSLPEEALKLAWAMQTTEVMVSRLNDGQDDRYQQPTPKARILAALHDIKAHEDLR